MTTREHWQSVYQTTAPNEVSWFSSQLQDSLRLIREVTSTSARIIDVGAGASTLVDDLLDLGYRHVTVLDVSAAALDQSRRRLGARAIGVTWLVADVTTIDLQEDRFDLWHDRAVFHFLTDVRDRQAYVSRARRSVAAGGHVVIGTFSMTGPAKCSGLDVVRYDAESLSAELGDAFTLTAQSDVTHVTPAGRKQSFLFCRFRKRD
jgi:SAM-dependent methyltransferase